MHVKGISSRDCPAVQKPALTTIYTILRPVEAHDHQYSRGTTGATAPAMALDFATNILTPV